MDLALLYLYSYLIGSVPTAYLIGRFVKGIDIRDYGSGNVGGTNVFLHVGKWWTVPLAIFDVFIKGSSPVWIGVLLLGISVDGPSHNWIVNYLFGLDRSSTPIAVASLLSIIGNNWSIFLKLQGGRGLTVASGSLFVMAFYELWIHIVGCLLGWMIFKSSATIALISLLLLPLWAYLLGQSGVVVWYLLGVLGIVILKRLVANGARIPKHMKVGRVLINRLLKDRDVDGREEWVYRTPSVGE